jgi:hypothetical protein
MSDKKSLEALWQQQPIQSPNFNELKDRFKAVRRKQWIYIGVDLISCLVCVFVLIFHSQKMNTIQLTLMALVTIFCVGSAAYITWLRSATLRNTLSDTRAYLQGLKHQYAMNIKIARYTHLVIWITVAFLFIFYTVTGVTQDWDTNKLIRKTFVLIVACGAMWPVRMWANRQIRKYSEELEKLTQLEQSIAFKEGEANA